MRVAALLSVLMLLCKLCLWFLYFASRKQVANFTLSGKMSGFSQHLCEYERKYVCVCVSVRAREQAQ